MKKTFVTLATVAALVAAAAPAVSTFAQDQIKDETYVDYFNGDTTGAKTSQQANDEAKAKIEAEEKKVAEEKAFNKANEAGAKGVWAEENLTEPASQGHYDVYLQGKQQNIPGEQGYSPAEEKKAEETASANTGKPAAKPVAAAKTATGTKTLPKTSAAK
ncbi:hypothetical protein [Streptococcus suis]|uniref:hypothetical protein n=1 Tax=Streptococcus suis TaxID=1307 RepID=UPI000CF42C47|nr:hypothetical protein [Streptococcus suis]